MTTETQAPVVFLDIETTGLDPDRHEVWDVGLIEADGTEHEWHIRPKRGRDAEPGALRITHFYPRSGVPDFWDRRETPVIVAEIVLLTAGMHLVGAVPSFDAAFLSRLFMENGQREAWHYHLVDVEALAAGRLGIAPPWDSHELSDQLGIVADPNDKHTGIGDARWAKQMYEAALDPGTVLREPSR